jgi:hypothetical protein
MNIYIYIYVRKELMCRYLICYSYIEKVVDVKLELEHCEISYPSLVN